ncbi:MAG: hypothetical protein KC635_13080 [Myxococcales bacterium]|nr:hypothetical protein [Myxococcales bacterium]MCB9731162.1 hypothetical protein [Deltaproteobacteria bacterium]
MRPALLLALALALAACGDDGGGPVADAADTTVADTTVDDTAVADTTVADTAVADTTVADTTATDTAAPTEVAATPGARCALTDRVGLVQIELQSDDPVLVFATASFFDRPNPWYGAPELTSDDCAFFRFAPTAACDAPCDEGEVCGLDGACVPAQAAREDAAFTLVAGEATQSIPRSEGSDTYWAQVTLSGTAFGVAVTLGGVRVTAAETAIPGDLTGLDGTLSGGYEAPTGLVVSWDAPSDGGDVTTTIPINHHAGGPTFTDCRVAASEGGFEVGEAMLAPLAVATGLEFQGVEHVRFAAAETAAGCVEIRWLRRFYPGFVHE